MSSSLVAVSAVLVAISLAYPQSSARQAVRSHLRKRSWLAWSLGRVHAGVYNTRLLVFRPPPARTDEVARFLFNPNGVDMGTVSRVHTVLAEITAATKTSVDQTQAFDHLKRAVDAERFHDLGFQTENPANDFRGAGQFGLQSFEYFCLQTEKSSRIIAESGSASSEKRTVSMKPWYPVALVSIRLSMKLSEILQKENMLVLRILQMSKDGDTEWLDTVKQLHVCISQEFHDTWMQACESGRVKHYFDTEFVLKSFESDMPIMVYDYEAVSRN